MSAEPQYVFYERDARVSVLTVRREPGNVVDAALQVQMQAAWQQAKADPSTTAVVLKADGKHFSAGANLKDFRPAPQGTTLMSPIDDYYLIRRTMKPTIAAVQGGCIGVSQRTVFACDLIFCTEDAFFMDPTVSMGLGGIQSHLHSWLYGPRLAKEMIYSGMRLPASWLYAMGQVNRLYPDLATLHSEALTFAHEVSEKDPVTLRQAKRAADTTMDIMGQHYVASRMDELMDEVPRFALDVGV